MNYNGSTLNKLFRQKCFCDPLHQNVLSMCDVESGVAAALEDVKISDTH